MEKLPHEEYRDELADKLKYIRNSDSENLKAAKAKAEGYLEAKKETNEYKDAKNKQLTKNKSESVRKIRIEEEKVRIEKIENCIEEICKKLVPLNEDLFELSEVDLVKIRDEYETIHPKFNGMDMVGFMTLKEALQLADKEGRGILSLADTPDLYKPFDYDGFEQEINDKYPDIGFEKIRSIVKKAYGIEEGKKYFCEQVVQFGLSGAFHLKPDEVHYRYFSTNGPGEYVYGAKNEVEAEEGEAGLFLMK